VRIVVLGYGNPLRGDDGVGWRVAEAVDASWAGQVLVRTGQQLVPEWAADLGEADVAYFVDASLEVAATTVRPVAAAVDVPWLDSHALDPAQLVRLTQAVYGRAPPAFAVHVPAARFEFGDTLSPVASAGVRDGVGLLNARIAQLTAG
jgi:hydrogenase maturation protease